MNGMPRREWLAMNEELTVKPSMMAMVLRTPHELRNGSSVLWRTFLRVGVEGEVRRNRNVQRDCEPKIRTKVQASHGRAVDISTFDLHPLASKMSALLRLRTPLLALGQTPGASTSSSVARGFRSSTALLAAAKKAGGKSGKKPAAGKKGRRLS